MSNQKVRVRYAPSPTGLQHLGGIRSALFNWLLARHSGGTFIWRVEDTDRSRYVEGAVTNLQDSLKWLGLEWDEGPEVGGNHGPYWQSERLELYTQYADQLLNEGKAYRDWTSPERLEELRRKAQAAKQPFIARKEMLITEGDADKPHVLRFAAATEGETIWEDAIRGHNLWQNELIDDFIIVKSDGYPMYNFANVIDDHLMEITHVLRGDEFLSSTPKHLQLYNAFGWEPATFAHLPPVMGPDGKSKLSKRHGAEPATYYRDQGYLPEAILNFLATLGWNDGTTQEIYSTKELIEHFSLERIHKSPAVFDMERLNWMNGMHIRQLSSDDLYKRVNGFWPKAAENFDDSYKKQVLGLVQERLKYFAELPELTDFFFTEPELDNKLLLDKLGTQTALKYLTASLEVIGKSEFSEAALEERLRQTVADLGAKTGDVFRLLRVSLTGRTAAPGLFETMVALGQERSLQRIKKATKALVLTS